MTPTNRFQTDPSFPFPAPMRKCTLCVVHTPIMGAADKKSLLLIKQIKIFAWRQTAIVKKKPKLIFLNFEIFAALLITLQSSIKMIHSPYKYITYVKFPSGFCYILIVIVVCLFWLSNWVRDTKLHHLTHLYDRRTNPINLNLQLIHKTQFQRITMNK